MNGNIIPIEHLVESWQQTWQEKFRAKWRIANDGKYYPRKPEPKPERRDLDDVIATVR